MRILKAGIEILTDIKAAGRQIQTDPVKGGTKADGVLRNITVIRSSSCFEILYY